MIKVTFDGLDYEVENGTKIIEFIRKNLDIDEETIMACKISNEVKSLDTIIEKDCKISFVDYTTADGSRIYVRGLTFIMLKAFEELYPEYKIIVNYSLGHSIYSESVDDKEITEEHLVEVCKDAVEMADKL